MSFTRRQFLGSALAASAAGRASSAAGIPAEWFQRIPKAELHLHLEGAIPLDALWELIRKYGGDPSVPTREALTQRFEYRDFHQFFQTWTWKNGFLRTYEDFTWLSEAVARDLKSQNIRYAEAFYSPGDFARHGLRVPQLTEAIRKGLDRVPGVEVALVCDLVRDYGPERGAKTLAELTEVRKGVAGIGIGGGENVPPEPFAQVYRRARELGFRTSAHAGEFEGPKSVWGAIRALKVDRIGHGTRAVEDPALVEELRTRRIPVEMCPTSNVRTGVVRSLREHPVKRLFDAGLVVTVNTDDPKMFGANMAGELQQLHEVLGFTRDQIRTLVLNAVRANWQPEERKRALLASFEADPAFRS